MNYMGEEGAGRQAIRVTALEAEMRQAGVCSPDRLLLKLYTAQEAAELLGLDLGTVRNLTYRRELPCVKIGRRCVRYRLLHLLEWINTRSLPAVR
jgi:excisionase family DNA binding protein